MAFKVNVNCMEKLGKRSSEEKTLLLENVQYVTKMVPNE